MIDWLIQVYRAGDLNARAQRYHVVAILVFLTCGIPGLFGIAMFASLDRIDVSPSWTAVEQVANIRIWATACLVLSVWTIIGTTRGLSWIQYSALASSLVFAGLALALAWSTLFDKGIGTGPIAYVGLSGLFATTSMACGEPMELHLPHHLKEGP